jgi:hypothetical protein
MKKSMMASNPETDQVAPTAVDWSDVEGAAKAQAGNWRKFGSVAWHRSLDLDDPDDWMLYYTSHRDSEELAKANERVIDERLRPFAESEDPDVVFERHDHFAVGFIDGFSLRVLGPSGAVTEAFKEFCRIMEALEAYAVLDEQA